MTDRIRQSIGGLCLAVALLVVGVIAYPHSDALGGVAYFMAALVGLVCLLNLALDLMKPRKG